MTSALTLEDSGVQPAGLAAWKQVLVLSLLASALPIYYLMTLPPLWLYLDSIVLTTWTINDGVMPHYPPLYPLFTRSINYATMRLFHGSGAGAVSALAYNFNDIGLYAILVLQHLLAIVAQ